jgi:hypothetical protein
MILRIWRAHGCSRAGFGVLAETIFSGRQKRRVRDDEDLIASKGDACASRSTAASLRLKK